MADDQLDLREQIIRIDRQIAETRKFVAEHDKLAAEAKKYVYPDAYAHSVTSATGLRRTGFHWSHPIVPVKAQTTQDQLTAAKWLRMFTTLGAVQVVALSIFMEFHKFLHFRHL
jgi:hypothetical protein